MRRPVPVPSAVRPIDSPGPSGPSARAKNPAPPRDPGRSGGAGGRRLGELGRVHRDSPPERRGGHDAAVRRECPRSGRTQHGRGDRGGGQQCQHVPAVARGRDRELHQWRLVGHRQHGRNPAVLHHGHVTQRQGASPSAANTRPSPTPPRSTTRRRPGPGPTWTRSRRPTQSSATTRSSCSHRAEPGRSSPATTTARPPTGSTPPLPPAASGSRPPTRPGPGKLHGDQSDEETWVKLPDGSILSYDVFASGGGTFQGAAVHPGHRQVGGREQPGRGATRRASSRATGPRGANWGRRSCSPTARSSTSGPTATRPSTTRSPTRGRRARKSRRRTSPSRAPAPSGTRRTSSPPAPAPTATFLVGTDDPGAMLPNGHILIALSPLGPLKLGGRRRRLQLPQRHATSTSTTRSPRRFDRRPPRPPA